MSEYKIFEDINLENNKIVNVSEISSYEGTDGNKYTDSIKKSGLDIHTPKNPSALRKTSSFEKDGGLVISSGHLRSFLDNINNVSNEVNSTVNNHLNVKSNAETDFISPVIDIKSKDSDHKTNILIRNEESSNNSKDNGITITTDRIKLIATTSKNKTQDTNNKTILDLSSSVDSHIDINRLDATQSNIEKLVVGTKYGYSSNNIGDSEGKYTSSKINGNALYVDTEKVNIYVPTKIISDTNITGTLTQTGDVKINENTHELTDKSTIIDGSNLTVDTNQVYIGTENHSGSDTSTKTKTIKIGTATTSTSTSNRNTIEIGSSKSDLSITGRDFLIDSDKGDVNNTSVDTTSSDTTSKSYLRSYYTNSNDSFVNDILTIGPNSSTNSHLQINGYADITGNLDVDGSIDVKDTVYFHSDNADNTTSSKIFSNTNNASLQINNDTEVIISNGDNDNNKISIKPNTISTGKNFDLNASQTISSTLTFDGEVTSDNTTARSIKDLNNINTDSLKISSANASDTVVSIVTNKGSSPQTSTTDSLTVVANKVYIESDHNTDDNNTSNGNIIKGKTRQTGNVYVNTDNGAQYNVLVKGKKTSIESATVNIGSETSSDTSAINIGTTKHDNTITIGKNSTETDYSNIQIKGKDLTLDSESNTASKLRVSEIDTDNVTMSNSLTIGDNTTNTATSKLYGHSYVSKNIDVKDTVTLHATSDSDNSTSYIKSNTNNDSLQINNDNKIILSNGANNVTIEPNEITTSKILDLNANQEISGTLTFDGSNDVKQIKDVRHIQTDYLKLNSNNVSGLEVTYNKEGNAIGITSSTLSITSDTTVIGDSDITGSIEQTGNTTITGDVNINDGDTIKTSNIDGKSVYINPTNVFIGNSDDNSNNTSSSTTDIKIGKGGANSNATSDTNTTIKGKRLSIESGTDTTQSNITVDKVSFTNAVDTKKINVYWDGNSSTLIFEKG